VLRVDLVTGTSEPVSRLDQPIFGKLPAADMFAVADDSMVGFVTVQDTSAGAPTPVHLPVRKRRDGSFATGRIGDMRLLSMHFDTTAEHVLLCYRGVATEAIEIFAAE
jgi:hypothetical protein